MARKNNSKKQEEEPKNERIDQEGQFQDEEEDLDVYGIHNQIVSREKGEPDEGFEPTPWWVWVISVLVLFIMGYYLGRYSGTFGTVAHEVEMPPQAAEERVERPVRGDLLYTGLCQPCHQGNGQGVPGRYPPLAGSEWVIEDAETPAKIVLHGLEGPIEVLGNIYNEQMDPFHHRLNDREIAAVVNYIRSSWGNEAPEITPERVAELREEHDGRGRWRAPELQALRTQ
jgi:mono/diheme cytochrome c family protein